MEVISTRRKTPNRQDKAVSLELVHTVGLSAATSQSLAYSPSSPGLIAYPAGVHVVLYDVHSQRQVRFLQAKTVTHCPINCATFSKDGQILAAGQRGQSPAVLLWEVSTGHCLQEMRGHKVGIAAIAWSPDGKYLVSAGCEHDGHVCLWDWATGLLLCKQYTQSALLAITFSEDSSVVSVGKEHFKVWGLSPGDGPARPSGFTNISLVPKKPANLKDHRTSTFVGVCACPSPTSSGVATTGVYALTSEGWLILMRAASRTMDKSVDLQVRAAYGLDVSVSQVACACASGVVRIFAVRTLQFKGSLPRPALKSHQGWLLASASAALGQNIPGRPNAATSDVFPDALGCCFNLSGTQLTVAYSDQSLFVWDVSDMSAVSRLHHLGGHSSGIWDLAVFPGSFSEAASPVHGELHAAASHLATCAVDGTIRVWTAGASGNKDEVDAFHVGLVGVLGVQAADSMSAAAAHAKYDADTPLHPPGVNGSTDSHRLVLRCLCVSMHVMHLAVGDHTGRLRIYDLHTMNLLLTKEAHEAEVLCLDYSPSSQDGACLLASGARDMRVHVHDARHDYQHVASYDDHCASVTAIRFCMGGNRLVSCGSDRNIIFRNLSTGGRESTAAYKVENVPRCAMQDLLVDPMDRHALTVGQDNIVRVWDIASGQLLRTISCDPSAGEILRLAMDPGGSVLACCNSEGGVQLFDYSSSQLLATCTGHGNRVTAAAVLPDCRGLITVGQDGCIMIWQLPLPLQQQMQKAADMKSKKMLNVRQKLTRGGQQDEADGPLVRVAQGKPLLQSEHLPKWAQSTPAPQRGEGNRHVEGAPVPASSRWAVNVGQNVTIHSDTATPATFKIGQRVPVQAYSPLPTPAASSAEHSDSMEEDTDLPLLASVNFSETSFAMGKARDKPSTNVGLADPDRRPNTAASAGAASAGAASAGAASAGAASAGAASAGAASAGAASAPVDAPGTAIMSEASKAMSRAVSNGSMSSFAVAAAAAAQAAGIVAATHLDPSTTTTDTQTDSPIVGLQSNTQGNDAGERVEHGREPGTPPRTPGCDVEMQSAVKLPPGRSDVVGEESDDSGERALIRAVKAASRTHSEDDEVQYYECSAMDEDGLTFEVKGNRDREGHNPKDRSQFNREPQSREGAVTPPRAQTDPLKKTYLARAQSASSPSSGLSPVSTPTGQQQASPATEDLPLARIRSAISAGEASRPSRMHADLERMRERLQGLHRDFWQQENLRSAGKRSGGARTHAQDGIGSPLPPSPSPFSPTSTPHTFPPLAAESSDITTPHDSHSKLPSPCGTPMDIDLPDSPASVSTHIASDLDGAARDAHPLYGAEVTKSLDAGRGMRRTGSHSRTRTTSPAPRPPSDGSHSSDSPAPSTQPAAQPIEGSAPTRNLPGNLVSNVHQRQLSLPAIKSAPTSSGPAHLSDTQFADSNPTSSHSSPMDSAHNSTATTGAVQPELRVETTAPCSPTFSAPKPPSNRSQSPVPSPPSRSPPSSTPFMRSPPGSLSTTPPTSRSVSTSLEATFSANLIQRSLDVLSSHPVEFSSADLPPLPAPSTTFNTNPHTSSTTTTAQHSTLHVEPHATQHGEGSQPNHSMSPPLSPQPTSHVPMEDDDSAKVWASLAEVLSTPSSPLVSQSQTMLDRKGLSGSGTYGGRPRTPRSRNASPGLNKKHGHSGANNKLRDSQTKDSHHQDVSMSPEDRPQMKPTELGAGNNVQLPSTSSRRLSTLRASYPGDQATSMDLAGEPHSVSLYEVALERFSAATADVLSRWQELQSLDAHQIGDPESMPSSSAAAAALKLQASYQQVLEKAVSALTHSLPPTTPSTSSVQLQAQPNKLFLSSEHNPAMSPSQHSVSTYGTTTGSMWEEQTERIAELVAQRVQERQAALLQELVAVQVQQQLSGKGISKQRSGDITKKKTYK